MKISLFAFAVCVFCSNFSFSLTEREELVLEHFGLLRYENVDFTQNEVVNYKGKMVSVFANIKLISFYTKSEETLVFSKSTINFSGNTLALNAEFSVIKNGSETKFKKILHFLLVEGKYLRYQPSKIYVAPVALEEAIGFIVKTVENSSIYNFNPNSKCCICDLICRLLKLLF